MEKLYGSHGGPRHLLSTIPQKDSYLFKIPKSVISFCFNFFLTQQFKIDESFFSGMVDHVSCL